MILVSPEGYGNKLVSGILYYMPNCWFLFLDSKQINEENVALIFLDTWETKHRNCLNTQLVLKLNKDGKAIEKATSFHLEFLLDLLWFNNKYQYLRS